MAHALKEKLKSIAPGGSSGAKEDDGSSSSRSSGSTDPQLSRSTPSGRVADVGHSEANSTSTKKSSNHKEDGARYKLRFTAGPSYDKSSQKLVLVNGPDCIVSDQVKLAVRINDYSGLPSGSPATSKCFDSDSGVHRKDSFSIAFAITPKDRPIATEHLCFGLDCGDNPIKKFNLPSSLVNTGVSIVTKIADSSLECDPHAEEPWVMGPVLCSATTTFRIGEVMKTEDSSSSWTAPDEAMEEGGVGSGVQIREDLGIPDSESKRRKHFSDATRRAEFTLEPRRTYDFDHAHGYIDWNECSLKLPGFTFHTLKYLGGSSHKVRFVLKDMRSGEIFFVIMCTLLAGDALDAALSDDEKRQKGELAEDAVLGEP